MLVSQKGSGFFNLYIHCISQGTWSPRRMEELKLHFCNIKSLGLSISLRSEVLECLSKCICCHRCTQVDLPGEGGGGR